MSNLVQLGRELDILLKDLDEVLPHIKDRLFENIHNAFIILIDNSTSQAEEGRFIPILRRKVQDIRDEFKGLLEKVT